VRVLCLRRDALLLRRAARHPNSGREARRLP
jgi:hypothetical protein